MFVPDLALAIREKISAVFYDGRILPKHTETEHFYMDTVDGAIYPSVTGKTSLLSRDYYKQMAADKAVDYIQEQAPKFSTMEPDEIAKVFAYAREAHVHDLNRAGTWGTHGHDLVDRYVQEWLRTNERPADIKAFVTKEISPEGICAGLSAMKFFDEHTLFPLASELRVVSKRYKYGGTLDSLWLVGDVHQGRIGDPSCKHDWFNKGRRRQTIACASCGRQEELSILLGDWKTSNQIFGVGKMSKFDYAMQVLAYAYALKELAHVNCRKHWIVRLDKRMPGYDVGVIVRPRQALKAFMSILTVNDFARSPVPQIEPLVKKNIVTL